MLSQSLHGQHLTQGRSEFAPDIDALAAHSLSLLQVVGILEQQGQVVEAAGSQRIV